MLKNPFYTAPDVCLFQFKAEHGFADSLEDPVTDPEHEW